ncbi:MAG: hypothetical protein H6704_08160 [Myxococcales bacterium]|nr:hypothetical protein [Myxococcales bacterium]
MSRIRLPLAGVAMLAALATGCSLKAMTGDMMSEYTVDELTPFLLASDDLGMACETGVSMGSYLMSFERVTDAPNKAAVSTLVTAGACAQIEAWEAELRSLRALHAGDAAGAQDARIAEKRANAVAARRFYRAWKYLVAEYGVPGETCPELEDESDELIWLLGMLAGVQATQHDRGANGMAGVPLDVPRQAARGVQCLNNEKWWGVPRAVSAAVWTSIPGAGPEGVDPWARLAEASALGVKAGVRVALAVEAQAAAAAGKSDKVRAAIKAYAAAIEEAPARGRFSLLDHNATVQVQVLSDRLWTEGTGHRTPVGALGTFWDDAPPAPEGGDDLLEGLEDDAPAQAAPAPGADGSAPPNATEE